MLGKAEYKQQATTQAAKKNRFYTFVNASIVILGNDFEKATLLSVKGSPTELLLAH